MPWYIRIMGEVQGPLTNEQLKARAEAKRIDKATEVAADSRGPWFAAGDVRNLFAAPPPLPAEAARQQQTSQAAGLSPRRVSRLALASFILGCVSYACYAFFGWLGLLGFLVGMLLAIAAVICGGMALRQIIMSRRASATGVAHVTGNGFAAGGMVVGAAVLLGSLGLHMPATQSARGAGRRTGCMSNMRLAAQGLLFAENLPGTLPAAIVDANGRPLLSWRVAILPYVEEGALFREFRLDEPWDSEHNRALISRMPDVYRCPSLPPDAPAGHTTYLAAAGPGMALDKPVPQRTRMNGARVSGAATSALKDGPERTILLVEVGQDAAVPWTKPDDLTCPVAEAYGRLFGSFAHEDTNCVVFADGHTAALDSDASPERIQALLTRAGNEPVEAEEP
jgi:hypothetical protein